MKKNFFGLPKKKIFGLHRYMYGISIVQYNLNILILSLCRSISYVNVKKWQSCGLTRPDTARPLWMFVGQIRPVHQVNQTARFGPTKVKQNRPDTARPNSYQNGQIRHGQWSIQTARSRSAKTRRGQNRPISGWPCAVDLYLCNHVSEARFYHFDLEMGVDRGERFIIR